MVAHQGEVEQETKTMQERMKEIIANYPSRITTEKIISIVQQLEDNTEIKVSQMSFVLNNQFSEVANAEMATQDANSSTTTDASTGETAGTTDTMEAKTYYGSFASLTMDYEADYDVLKKAINEINKKIRPTNTQCEFKYHEQTHRISITVRDRATDEVIKEIPPEKTLDMIAKSLELAGILVDEKRQEG